jgi:hypothetical protein
MRIRCTDIRSLKNSALFFIDFEQYRVLLGLLFGPLTLDAEGEIKNSVVARGKTPFELTYFSLYFCPVETSILFDRYVNHASENKCMPRPDSARCQ